MEIDLGPVTCTVLAQRQASSEVENLQILKAKEIELVETELSSPIVYIPNEEGYLPFCEDHSKLNEITVRCPYAVPRIFYSTTRCVMH